MKTLAVICGILCWFGVGTGFASMAFYGFTHLDSGAALIGLVLWFAFVGVSAFEFAEFQNRRNR